MGLLPVMAMLDLQPRTPATPSPGVAADARSSAGRREDQPRILIVEDDFLVASEIEAALSDAGFAVAGVATTATQAVNLAKTERPTLIVMDIRLAGSGDGIDAALEIYRSTGIRCIFATAYVEPALRGRAAAAAPLGWLSKPYTSEALMTMIHNSLNRPKQ
jgi:two-component system, response regulator PdtaR